MKHLSFLLPLFFLFSFILVSPHTTFAQQGTGVKIVPATIEKLLDPGEILQETLVVTNTSDEEKEYFLFKRDIKGVEDGGVPIFAEVGAEITGFEMSQWVKTEDASVILAPGEERVIDFEIVVPEDASPGSHFAGFFVSAEPPKLREIGAGVGYEVASILSIRIKGDVIDNTRIRSFSSDKLFYGEKNVQFTAKLENQGNILVRPRGPLTITSMFGGDPYVMTVNDNLAGVFPGTVRDIEFEWVDDSLGFGRYEAVLALVYDGDRGQKTIDASIVFWVFPSKIIVPLSIGFVVFVSLGYLLTRLYINRAIERAGAGRRMSTQRYRKQVGISRFAFVFVSLMAVIVLFLIILLIFFA